MISDIQQLAYAALNIRKDLLKLCTTQSIHIGGDLSIADVMTVLWQYQMKYDPKNPKDENRDRFVLSKGHASAVTAFNQAAIGCFDKECVFKEYATDGGRFSMHSCNLINPYVEVSTGSLGHGMPVACGIAQALKLKGNLTSRVYVVMGDGEQSEGSVWEAAVNAVHYRLNNLIGIVDFNGFEADGKISEITALGNIAEKYRAVGWNTLEINGHNICEIKDALNAVSETGLNTPSVIVCYTIKGKGVSFMENNARWHAGKITEKEYNDAVCALDKAFCEIWGKKYHDRNKGFA